MSKFIAKGETSLEYLVEKDKISGGYFNYEDVKNAVMTKQEMYIALSGKNVKCIYTEGESIGLFAVQDLQNNHVYLLDNLKIK